MVGRLESRRRVASTPKSASAASLRVAVSSSPVMVRNVAVAHSATSPARQKAAATRHSAGVFNIAVTHSAACTARADQFLRDRNRPLRRVLLR
jgi:hypothetical protein